MGRFFVAGLINLETTVAIDGFPLDYFPVRYPFFGLRSAVSGVGYNLAKALTVLGNEVVFASLTGTDGNGDLVRKALSESRIRDGLVLNLLDETPQSVILYDPQGRRQIHVDLKDIQDRTYPVSRHTETAIQSCDLAVICNASFTRPLLALAWQEGKRIATDLHALSDLDDPYNREYMEAAEILFLSDEALPVAPEDTARALLGRTHAEIVGIGLGGQGALLAVRKDDFIGRFPAVETRPVVNTIGAGDALFSAFLHSYCRDHDPYRAIQAAQVFASYKIGETGAAHGFLGAEELDSLIKTKDDGGMKP